MQKEAVRSDATDLKSLRDMCVMREIPWHPRHKAQTLRRLIDEYDIRNAPPGDLKDQVEVANPGFASAEPQTPEWAKQPDPGGPTITPPTVTNIPPDPPKPAAETYTPSPREIPANVQDALKWLSSCSIGRVKLIRKYINTLL